MNDSLEAALAVQALKIEPGTLLVLGDVELDEDASFRLVKALEKVAGHDKFVILHTYNGAIATAFTAEQVVAMLKQLTTATERTTTDGEAEASEGT